MLYDSKNNFDGKIRLLNILKLYLMRIISEDNGRTRRITSGDSADTIGVPWEASADRGRLRRRGASFSLSSPARLARRALRHPTAYSVRFCATSLADSADSADHGRPRRTCPPRSPLRAPVPLAGGLVSRRTRQTRQTTADHGGHGSC